MSRMEDEAGVEFETVETEIVVPVKVIKRKGKEVPWGEIYSTFCLVPGGITIRPAGRPRKRGEGE